MQLTEITYAEAQPVEGYGPGFFRIGGTVLHGPLSSGERSMESLLQYIGHAAPTSREAHRHLRVGATSQAFSLPSLLLLRYGSSLDQQLSAMRLASSTQWRQAGSSARTQERGKQISFSSEGSVHSYLRWTF